MVLDNILIFENTIINSAKNKKGENVKVINLDKNSSIADKIILITGLSPTNCRAIADEIDKNMSENKYFILGKEGYKEGEWILLDYNDIIVHIFTKDLRDYYNIEKLYNKSI